MQTLTLDNLPTPVLLAWGLPEDVDIADLNDFPEQPQSDWKLIGKLSELTEGLVEELVDRGSYVGTYKNYKTNDNHKSNQLGSPLESFDSAIEAEGYFVVNPYSEPIYTTEHSDDCYCLNCEKETKRCADLQDKARQAQSRTLPANTLVFKKEA